jgi:4-amino-4-deoxy-L-arabinose transferase-like glycosyltransferase
VSDRLARLRHVHPATLVLAALVVAGVALRVLGATASWPVSTTLADAGSYAAYATANPMEDPLHTAGYSSFLAVVGVFTREVAVVTILQHLLAIITALLFYAAVRRVTRSHWAGLLPAALVLLNADLVFLERNVLSETLFMTVLAGTFYAAVRAFDAPDPWWRWPAATGALVGLVTIMRATGVFLLPVVVLAILLIRPGRLRNTWRAPAVAAAAGAIVLVLYALGNLASNGRFEVGPTQGWHLYGRVAPFADCRQFRPPAGTEGLCEQTRVPQRPNGSFYMHDAASPARRLFGPEPWAKHDADMRAFAMQVITHQPRAYATAMWRDVKTYFAPDSLSGPHLDGELDWSRANLTDDPIAAATETAMERFFDPFRTHASAGTVAFLHDYQRVFRFGATWLSIASIVVAIGLLVGPRRSRVGVLVFGIGGLALLVAPVLSVFYVARYTVPVGAPLFAAAAITAVTLRRMEADRSHGVKDTRA